MPKYAEYPCERCREPLCICYQQPERITHRNRELTGLRSWQCPSCPMDVFWCVTDRDLHWERRHQLVSQATGVNGMTPA